MTAHGIDICSPMQWLEAVIAVMAMIGDKPEVFTSGVCGAQKRKEKKMAMITDRVGAVLTAQNGSA